MDWKFRIKKTTMINDQLFLSLPAKYHFSYFTAAVILKIKWNILKMEVNALSNNFLER